MKDASVASLRDAAGSLLGNRLLDLTLVNLWLVVLLLELLEALIIYALEAGLALWLAHLWHALAWLLPHLVHLELHVLSLRVAASCLLLHQELLELRVHHLLLSHVLWVCLDLLRVDTASATDHAHQVLGTCGSGSTALHCIEHVLGRPSCLVVALLLQHSLEPVLGIA